MLTGSQVHAHKFTLTSSRSQAHRTATLVHKIQHFGPISWSPLDDLYKLFLKYGFMGFTFENPFQLVRIFFLCTSYIFHELERQILGVHKIQHWGPIFWIPLD